MLHLGHAQIVFTLVVGEGGILYLHEAQDWLSQQQINQIRRFFQLLKHQIRLYFPCEKSIIKDN